MIKKILITAFLLGITITAAQANIFCPKGPAECIKSSDGKVACTLVGNDGTWHLFAVYPGFSDTNTHFFVFQIARSRVDKVHVSADSACSYADLSDSEPYVAIFRPNMGLQPVIKTGYLWTPPTKSGITNCLSSVPDFCPFTADTNM